MASTDQILANLGAIQTFLENFPMSILDLWHGKVYTSVFDFIIDVLIACGVDIAEIQEKLLNEIYGIKASIEGGIEGFYAELTNGEIAVESQNEFLQGLEYSIKGILMALFSSVFTCSALPVLPNKVFDGPSNFFDGNTNAGLLSILRGNMFKPFIIPSAVIDPMGILSICPTSTDGQFFYEVEGKDYYYRKEWVNEEISSPAYTEADQVGVYLKVKYPAPDEYSEDANTVCLTKSISNPVTVTIEYIAYGNDNRLTWSTTINAGSTESPDEWLISPTDQYGYGQKSAILAIRINNVAQNTAVGEDKWLFLDKDSSSDFVKRWNDEGAISVENADLWGKKDTTTLTVTENKVLKYQPITMKEAKQSGGTISRFDIVPDGELTDDYPEYIVCYEGFNPNTLYKSTDMNAFLWFVLHKGMVNSQEEFNHLMWDSRVSALKNGIYRSTPEEWNDWYVSKETYFDEFKDNGAYLTENSPIYPVIQLEPVGVSESTFRVHIPAQRYFKPSTRNAILRGDNPPEMGFNASLYRFNWEYLQSIQILHPKLMLIGLCEYLLGFSLSTISSTKISITKKIIEAKLSSAVKSIIEADDMEVEDCYTSFTNDEVNDMLEEMLLARYTASNYGGESSPVRKHNVDDYLSILDTINPNTNREGTVTQISRLVTEVTADPGTEGSINYGLQVSTDGNILQKLLWAIAMPIIQSIFTPQVMLLIVINFELMGITRIDEFLNNDYGKILNLLLNKILGLVKSIVRFIKDKIIELLLRFLYEKLLPLLAKYQILLVMEQLSYYIELLSAIISCLPMFKISRKSIIGSIDDVNYADIVETQATPEASSSC